MANYDALLDRIAKAANVARDEVERRIEGKRAKLSGLISKEGAAQIIAAELGISFDNELMKINELVEGMKRAHVVGKITQVFPVRSYSKNGREGQIGSFLLGDETSNLRVVLWDAHHIDLLNSGALKEESVVEILNASMRNGELHLGAFSDLKQSSEVLAQVHTSRVLIEGSLLDAKPGAYLKIRGTIVQIFDPKIFEDKKNPGQQRALVNFVLDDGSETIRALANERTLEQFGVPSADVFSSEAFVRHKDALLGEEMFFVGSCKTNTYFNRVEMNIEKVERLNPEELIVALGRN
ncbi:MAG: hypothetical protein AABX53_02180 [Nanoarchaeota archaeon]